VALKPLGGYGKPAELFTMVEKGAIEMAATVQGYHPGRFPQSSVMELPFMFENSIAGTSAMMSLYKEGLLDKDYATVKVFWASTCCRLIRSSRPARRFSR
jgi:TRAP-type C4-dicarboxylate transport system substrate-binding protein